ncbi:MAG: type 4a pilus biogenesis protein PilO [Nitrospirales bacterium]|nr:type 4a pilus biogenesis protein PilO [Nitrospirales bacterium]
MDSVTTSQRVALGMVMIGLVVCGFFVVVWGPIQSRTEIVRGEVQQLGQEIQHYASQNLHHQDWQARIKELEIRVYGDRQNVRRAMGQEGLRTRVTGIAKNYQLELTYWQPEALGEEYHDVTKRTPIRVQIEGGYHQVAKFFSRVLHLPDVFGISHFTIGVTNDQSQPFHLQTNFVMTRLNPILPGDAHTVEHSLSNRGGPASRK